MKPPSDHDLLEMSREHLASEIHMLSYCVPRIDGSQPKEQNLYIEGFVLRLRNLIEFFFASIPQSPKHDDMRAAHFLALGEWEKIRGEESSILEEAYIRANNKLAHLHLFPAKQGRIGHPANNGEIGYSLKEVH